MSDWAVSCSPRGVEILRYIYLFQLYRVSLAINASRMRGYSLPIGVSSISSAQEPRAAVSSVYQICRSVQVARTLVAQKVPKGHLLLFLLLGRSYSQYN